MNIIVEDKGLTDEQKEKFKGRIYCMYQMIEKPMVEYISSVTNIAVNNILIDKELLQQGGLEFELDEEKYRLGIELIQTDKYVFKFPMEQDHIHRAPISYYIGELVWFMKIMAHKIIFGNSHMSPRIKNIFNNSHVKFDEDTSTFYISHEDGTIFQPDDHRLGFVFTKIELGNTS